jgi:lipoprotein-anchoring transpeptidase ErfK/SrfK
MRRSGPVVVLAVLALAGCGGAGEPRDRAVAQEPPAFEQATPAPTPAAAAAASDRPAGRHLTARLTRATRLRATPGGRVIRHLGRRTEFGSHTTLAVLRRRGGWLKVVTPKLPNHRHGWIPAANAELGGTDYEIVVDRSAHRATLRHGGKRVLRFPVAVGRPGNETPLGRFAVTDKLAPTDATSPYGCCALALSGHQTRLEPGWPGGDRLAIHGTPATWSIGKAVSLGCMRAPEKALRRLMRSVPLGAPVVIRA